MLQWCSKTSQKLLIPCWDEVGVDELPVPASVALENLVEVAQEAFPSEYQG